MVRMDTDWYTGKFHIYKILYIVRLTIKFSLLVIWNLQTGLKKHKKEYTRHFATPEGNKYLIRGYKHLVLTI